MLRGDWPKNPAIYQVYPRSFLDTTGSGEGDLAGITRKMSWIADLGVDAVWLSPFFVSPMVDGGYDVADHKAVDPRFGTMADFEALVEAAHGAGLRVMIDQVLNHTSDRHPLFQAAIAGDEFAADCYLWRDPKPDGTQPNNWLSQFGQPAWTWNHRRRQYYFHQFLAVQPSLNLRNPHVQDLHRDEITFWRGKGVDGFRFDAVTSYLFDESLKDNPPASPEVQDRVSGANFVPYTYQDHVYDMLPGDGAAYAEKLRDWAGDDAYLIGESTSGNQQLTLALAFTEPGRLDGCYTIDMPEKGATPEVLQAIFDQIDDPARVPKWLSSHDQPRHVSSAGDGTDRDARFFALMMAALPGPWLLFQGEELGLPQATLSQEETVDPLDLLYWPDGPGRDGARVPLPWSDGPNCGFTGGTPWLPMRWSDDRSVAAQSEQSIRGFYREVIAARRDAGWGDGRVTAHGLEDDLLTVETEAADTRWRVRINYGPETVETDDGPPFLSSQPSTGAVMGRSVAVWKAG
ncbi:alpha-amylase family glycosyl hydrolase [Jannaschia marina]|uniref:alpha-amylase family glycosyl hydrolase n=1 Tax=Jannaschia marina TaxID=2741674 RepID=UPI0015CAE97E|nr:alpha-amylase family glycosyl hydrolase [Jannaschia marina]